jgi:hypothetical protein
MAAYCGGGGAEKAKGGGLAGLNPDEAGLEADRLGLSGPADDQIKPLGSFPKG